MKDLIPVILKVIIDIRVIATVIVMLFVIEFAKFVTTYKKRPPRPKKAKSAPKAAPAPKAEEKQEEAPAEEEE